MSFAFTVCSLSAQETATTKSKMDSGDDASFRLGQTPYSAKPKNAWELGIHLGHYFIDGDVDTRIPGGYGVGLHLRKAVHYVFSVRADLFYGVAKGIEPQPWSHHNVDGNVVNQIGGGLVEDVYDSYNPSNGHPDGIWFPAYKTRQIYGALEGIINVGNILFHKDRNKWNWYVGLGAGLSSRDTKLDLGPGAIGSTYSGLLATTGWTYEKFNTKAGRKDIKAKLDAVYDGVYETQGFKKAGIFRLGDETNIAVMFIGSVGVARKLSKRFNLGIEHQIMASDDDYLDGIRFRTEDDLTADVDMQHYTNIRLGINLGNFDKVTEPLYWLNPLDATLNDIAGLKARPQLDLTDSDGDGVIDMMDQENNTVAGASVDTRGVTLDSDGDGLADHVDKEPFSPIGHEIDKDGVAKVVCCITETDVNRMIDAKTGALLTDMKSKNSNCGKWYLPMIHFDLDKYSVKPEFYGHLYHVANVMKMCPDMCVTAVGHTDVRNTTEYNKLLSYNRAQAAVDHLVNNFGIDRSRLKLMYGGEDANITKGTREGEHYMNRRVEFRVCDPSDAEMVRPAGGSAGSGDKKSGKVGSTFKGNKNSGY